MQLSNQGLEFIKIYEIGNAKPHLKAIKSPELNKDGTIKYEIGYGHNSDSFYKVTKDSVITENQAIEILEHDIKEACTIVDKFIEKYDLDFNQHGYDALVSAVYNGVKACDGRSGLSKALIKGDLEEVKKRWAMYVYASGKYMRGLALRRADELELFFKGNYKRDY